MSTQLEFNFIEKKPERPPKRSKRSKKPLPFDTPIRVSDLTGKVTMLGDEVMGNEHLGEGSPDIIENLSTGIHDIDFAIMSDPSLYPYGDDF